jgi:hypothetical protein
MCGRRDGLVVDHIVPVSVGGAVDAVTNMQMLCIDCNLGKSAMADRLLPTVVALAKTPMIGARMRFKHLLLDSVVVDGRTRGVCACGEMADANELHVSVVVPNAAANLLTLTTRCADCP